MAEINVFEKATKMKYRFAYKGNLTVEDLWDLPVEELDLIFKDLNSKNKASAEESLLKTETKKNQVLEDKIAIIKHIVNAKLGEKAAAEKRAKKKEEKQKLLAILANKEDEELKGKSAEEIREMIENLDEDDD